MILLSNQTVFCTQDWLPLVLVTTCCVSGMRTIQSILTTFRLSGKASSLKSLLLVLHLCWCIFVWNFFNSTPVYTSLQYCALTASD